MQQLQYEQTGWLALLCPSSVWAQDAPRGAGGIYHGDPGA